MHYESNGMLEHSHGLEVYNAKSTSKQHGLTYDYQVEIAYGKVTITWYNAKQLMFTRLFTLPESEVDSIFRKISIHERTYRAAVSKDEAAH